MIDHRSSFALALALAVLGLTAARADMYTVAEGETTTLTSITNTSRFTKSGAGTLVLTGTNSLTTLTSSGGTLNFHGGLTTISGSGASGAYGSAAFVNNGDNLVVDGGATVQITGGQYGNSNNGVLLVTNGTFDATGLSDDFMNGFYGTFPSSRIVINNGGVVSAGIVRVAGAEAGTAAKKEYFSIDLNAGGTLNVKQFWEDNGDRYGRINFNGGEIHPTSTANLFNNGDSNKTWTESLVTPTVLEGGCYIRLSGNNFIHPAFMSGVGEGETDGGLHVSGTSVLYWRAKGSTYNGGTWLEGSGIFALNGSVGDTCLGALPEKPETNIWVTSNHTLFSEGGTMSVHSNRTIFVKGNKTFPTGTQGRLVIGGEIKAEPSQGCDYSTNNEFYVRSDWNGTVVIGPGEGRTNDVGRMRVYGCLEVTNGVTRITGGNKMGDHNIKETLYVMGNSSAYNNYKGHLLVTGGELYMPQSYYVQFSKHGHLEVRGGKVNMPNANWLVGLVGCGKISVSNSGEVVTGTLRLGQGASFPTEFYLGKGGTLRSWQLTLEFNNNQDVSFNFDGGYFQSGVSSDGGSSLFNSPSHAKWDGVKFYVREGGAVLDSSAGKHVWWARPLISGAEQDGGLTCVLGHNKDVVLCTKAQCTYNGPTRTVFTSGTNIGALQCRVANALPATTTLQIGPHTQVGFNSAWSGSANNLDQTVARVEGVGIVVYCSKLVVTNGISAAFDGVYGTLTFDAPCSLAGDYVIAGDMEGCGCVKFRQNQDISNLTLKFADVEALDAHANSSFYKILDAPNGYTGKFQFAADWPSAWSVKYTADGKSAYVYRVNGTKLIVR